MTDATAFDLKSAARALRVAALQSLGREDEIPSLPPIEGSMEASVRAVDSGSPLTGKARQILTAAQVMVADDTTSKSMRGTVKWFNAEKGFGFITPDNGAEDLFAHYSVIEASGYRSLQAGDSVEIEIGVAANRPKGTAPTPRKKS